MAGPAPIFIIAGESSGELFGALLAREIKKLRPDAGLYGIGGDLMKAEGVHLLAGVSGAFGLIEAASHLKDLKASMKALLEAADTLKPKVAVLIDFPGFNFRAAAHLREKGIKIPYYVSPQFWAWRAGRIKKMARLVDRAALILPFEGELYKKAGITHEFVGHPVLDEIAAMPPGKISKKEFGIDEDTPVLSILPGSRPSELKKHLPLVSGFLDMFSREYPDWKCVIPLAPNLDTQPFITELRRLRAQGAIIKRAMSLKALSVSEAAIVASGTAALQAAFMRKPAAVFYKLSPFTFYTARLFVKVKYVSLVNILYGDMIVREFLQDRAKPSIIMEEVRKIIGDPDYSGLMKRRMESIREQFEGKHASKRVAQMALELMGENDQRGNPSSPVPKDPPPPASTPRKPARKDQPDSAYRKPVQPGLFGDPE